MDRAPSNEQTAIHGESSRAGATRQPQPPDFSAAPAFTKPVLSPVLLGDTPTPPVLTDVNCPEVVPPAVVATVPPVGAVTPPAVPPALAAMPPAADVAAVPPVVAGTPPVD